MKKRWLFVSDVDGTLLHGRGGIPTEVVEAADAFQKLGGVLTLCTGRARSSTGEVAKLLGISVPCILYGGAALYDFTAEAFVKTFPMPETIFPLIERVLAEFEEVSVQAYTARRNHMLRQTPYLVRKGIPGEQEGWLSKIEEIEGEVLKLVLACEDRHTLELCNQKIFADSPFLMEYASTHFAEVQAPGVSKATMMRYLAERLEIPDQRIFSAGNGMTDLPMLRASAVSFVPLGSPTTLLDAATMVVPSAIDGGMSTAFREAADIVAKAQGKASSLSGLL